MDDERRGPPDVPDEGPAVPKSRALWAKSVGQAAPRPYVSMAPDVRFELRSVAHDAARASAGAAIAGVAVASATGMWIALVVALLGGTVSLLAGLAHDERRMRKHLAGRRGRALVDRPRRELPSVSGRG